MAQVYAISEPLTYDENGVAKITLKDLVDEGIASKNIIDPMCGKPFSQDETYIEVTDINGNLEYNVVAITGCNADLPPFINDINISSTHKAITINVDATNGGGAITKYYYSIDNGTNYIESIESSFTINDLTGDTSYNIKVKVEDSKSKITEANTLKYSTKDYYVPSIEATTIHLTEDNKLDNGLIPIYYDEAINSWVVADKLDEWYDYEQKKWANAISVTESSRSAYISGKELVEDDVLAYFVYIPRYSYTLFNVESAVIDPLSIPITFVDVNTKTAQAVLDNPQNGDEYVHPAFTFGTDELEGIWVGKFELTPLSQDYEINDPNVMPTVKPGISSLRNQNVATFFTTIQKFNDSNTYGINNNADVHMIKNTEWGAMAYLSHSIYGVNTKVRINNNSNYITGCGAAVEPILGSDEYITSNACEIEYNSSFEQLQSTTGNIYGIYDTSGAGFDYVMGIFKKIIALSGLETVFFEDSSNEKYYNNYYSEGNGLTLENHIIGTADMEARNWYGTYSAYLKDTHPYYVRGGYNKWGRHSNIFTPGYARGQNSTSYSSRAIIPQFR